MNQTRSSGSTKKGRKQMKTQNTNELIGMIQSMPWQMTREQWLARDKSIWGELSAEGTGLNAAKSFHRVTVRDALREGKPVPADVLAEYGLKPTPPAAEVA